MTASTKSQKPYGFVLVLRGLAMAAIQLADHPSALRVLCVASQYMDADGQCRVGQDTIAAALGISRQAANKHFAKLAELGILLQDQSRQGATISYQMDLTDLEAERAGEMAVRVRRAAKKENRKGFIELKDRPGFLEWKTTFSETKDLKAAERAMRLAELCVGIDYEEVVKGETFRRARDANPAPRPELRIVPNEQPVSALSNASGFHEGQCVNHPKFGNGRVSCVDPDKKALSVVFDSGQERRIHADFVRIIHHQGATSEVAGGAT